MNLRQVFLPVLGTLLIYSLSSAEPTITPSGSVQVTGEVNNGKSSFRTETNLSLEINFSDNVTGYVQATNDSSNDQSSAQIHQAFVVLAGSRNTKENEKETTKSTITNKKQLTDKDLAKITRTASAKLFPIEKKTEDNSVYIGSVKLGKVWDSPVRVVLGRWVNEKASDGITSAQNRSNPVPNSGNGIIVSTNNTSQK